MAHLLDPAVVNGRMAGTQVYFERVAAEQLAKTAAGQRLRDEALQNRVRELGTRLNVANLANQIRRKIIDEPSNLRDLKRFARAGSFQSSGDNTTTVTLKDATDRALYFKKIGQRWFMENRKEPAAAKE